jgi:hypothetical protein
MFNQTHPPSLSILAQAMYAEAGALTALALL